VDGIIIKAVKFEGPVVGGKIVDVIPLGPEIGACIISAEILLGPEIGACIISAEILLGPEIGACIISAEILLGPEIGVAIVEVIPLGPVIGVAIDAEILLGPVIGIGGRTWQAFPFKTAGLRYFERTESLNPSRSVSTKHAFKEPPYLGQFLEYICSDVLEFFTFRVSCRFLPLRYAVPFAFLYFLIRSSSRTDGQ